MRDETHSRPTRSPHEMSACALTIHRLPLFVGGDLEGKARAEVVEHLTGCAACAEAAAESSRARDLFVAHLANRPASVQRPGLWPALRTRLLAEGILGEGAATDPEPIAAASAAAPSPGGSVPTPGRLRLLPRRYRRIAGVVAAAAAILFLVVVADPHGLRGDGDPSLPGGMPLPGGTSLLGGPGPVAVGETPPASPVSTLEGLRRPSAEEAEALDTLLHAAGDRTLPLVLPTNPGLTPTGSPGAALAGHSNPRGLR